MEMKNQQISENEKLRYKRIRRLADSLLYVFGSLFILGAAFKIEQLTFISVALALVGLFLKIILAIRCPFQGDIDVIEVGQLLGSNRYEMIQNSIAESVEQFTVAIANDGYEYAGDIENPFNAVMRMYLRSKRKRRIDPILIIEAESFTMDMLLEYRNLFLNFVGRYYGIPDSRQRRWGSFIWDLRTVLCVRKMTAPLQILLSTMITRNRDEDSQVIGLVDLEKRIYSKAWDSYLPMNSTTPGIWLKKHIVGPEYREPEHVWKGQDWSDIFFLDWHQLPPQEALRYESVHSDKNPYLTSVKASLTKAGYKYKGDIGNHYGASMEVYALEESKSQITVITIEADEITEKLLLEHRYLLREFMDRQGESPEVRWQEGIRLVIGVRKMTTELQILLCSQINFVKPIMYFDKPNSAEIPQVFAMVEEEGKVYTMAYSPGEFYHRIKPWMRDHILGAQLSDPEKVWEGLQWHDLDGLPMKKNELIVKVYKALWAYPEGYKEPQD